MLQGSFGAMLILRLELIVRLLNGFESAHLREERSRVENAMTDTRTDKEKLVER